MERSHNSKLKADGPRVQSKADKHMEIRETVLGYLATKCRMRDQS
jgi:hypothetical protein